MIEKQFLQIKTSLFCCSLECQSDQDNTSKLLDSLGYELMRYYLVSPAGGNVLNLHMHMLSQKCTQEASPKVGLMTHSFWGLSAFLFWHSSFPAYPPSVLLSKNDSSLDLTFCSFLRWFPWGSNFLLAFYQPNWNWVNHGWRFHVASFCAGIIPRWHYPLKLLLI